MSGIRIRLLAAIGILSGASAAVSYSAKRLTRLLSTSSTQSTQPPEIKIAAKGSRRPDPTRKGVRPAPQVGLAPSRPAQATARGIPNGGVHAIDGVPTHHNTDMSQISGVYGFGKELFQRFGSDQCGSWAASLSFFAILSIAPILLCGLALLGFFFHDANEALRRVREIVSNLVPDRASANALIDQLQVKDAASTLISAAPRAALIGILSLIWSSLQIFVNAVAPINAAFRAKETRNWLNLRLSALALLIATGIMFVCSLIPTSGLALINQLGLGHLARPTPPLLAVLFFAVGLALNGLTITVIYKFLPSPSSKVSWRATVTAGAIVAVLSELAKQAFAFYLQKFANYNKIYGTFGSLVAIIFWIYYCSMILLLGAEIAKLYQDSLDYSSRRKLISAAGEVNP